MGLLPRSAQVASTLVYHAQRTVRIAVDSEQLMEQHDEESRRVASEDTMAINLHVGGRVRCITGELKGVEGEMVATRTEGRVLIRLATGVYLELPRICVQGVDSRGK